MLSLQKRKELLEKEQRLKEKCRENLNNKQNQKWVWLHIKNTTDIENHVK